MTRSWTQAGPDFEAEWGGRAWTLRTAGPKPGLWIRGGSIGPLLGLDGLAIVGRTDHDALALGSEPRLTDVGNLRVEVVFSPPGWGAIVTAAWTISGEDSIDLEVEATSSEGRSEGFEVKLASILPEPQGSRRKRWVEPRDAAAAGLSYDGREPGVGDLTTLPPASENLAPRVLPSPWEDGLSYVEMVLPGEVARRVTEAGKISSLGHTTRYGLFGRDLAPGSVLRTRLRGLWLLSSDPQSEALDRANAFRDEEPAS